MAVRVIIDRKVKKGKESEFSELLKQLRSKAVASKGYISGETKLETNVIPGWFRATIREEAPAPSR